MVEASEEKEENAATGLSEKKDTTEKSQEGSTPASESDTSTPEGSESAGTGGSATDEEKQPLTDESGKDGTLKSGDAGTQDDSKSGSDEAVNEETETKPEADKKPAAAAKKKMAAGLENSESAENAEGSAEGNSGEGQENNAEEGENNGEGEATGVFTITFNAMGGKVDGDRTTTRKTSNNQLNPLPTPVRDGYKFVGWYDSANGGSQVSESYYFNYDQTLYAHWAKTGGEYTITLDANGGTLPEGTEKTATTTDSMLSSDTLPGEEVMTRDGYTFIGWGTGKNSGSNVGSDTVYTKDTTLYANWNKEYDITFNPNGGKIELPTDPVSYTTNPVTYTTIFNNLYNTTPTPVRDGYVFDGWYTEGGDKFDNFANDFYSDETFYARWAESDKQFTVTFDANGGKFADDNTTSTKQTDKDSRKLSSLPATPARDGYYFNGWNLSQDGSGDWVTYGTDTTFTEDTTVYAIWYKEISYTETVRFEANGGIFSDGKELHTATATNGCVAPSDCPKPSREGYNFVGWYTRKKVGGTLFGYSDDGSLYVYGDVTLYARWAKEDGAYTITLDAKGGTLPAGSSSTVTTADSMLKSDTLPEPIRDGYSFLGWYTQARGGELVVSDTIFTGNTTIFTGNTTIYAHWMKEYTVTLDANGGSFTSGKGEENFITESHRLGESFANAQEPTREGYTFKGWYDDKTGGSRYYPWNGTEIDDDLTLYAHWAKIGDVFQITFDANGGDEIAQNVAYTEDGMYRNLPEATRDGYMFDGWYTRKDGGDQVTEDTVYTEDTTVYAHWTEESTVTFYANGGKFADGTETATALTNEKMLVDVDVPTPTRDGYNFTGWYTDPQKGGLIDIDDYEYIDEDTAVYAHWAQKGKAYTVTFDVNAADGSVSPVSAVTTDSMLSEDKLPYPVRDNYLFQFDGWYTAPKGGERVDENYVYNADTTIYAHWGKWITVTFNPNGGETDYNYIGAGDNLYDMDLYVDDDGGTLHRFPMAAREGYRFDGWFTAEDGGTLISLDTVFKEDTEVYAHWTEDSTAPSAEDDEYIVAFNPMGGTVTPAAAATKNQKLTKLPVPTREGYTFTGWIYYPRIYYPISYENRTVDVTEQTRYSSFTTLYAQWEEKPYAVTYTDGVENEEIFPDQTVRAAEGESTPAFNGNGGKDPVRKGYVFAGWSPEVSETVTKDVTYTAQWKEDRNNNGKADETETYTVTYDPNGGTWSDGSTAVRTVTKNIKVDQTIPEAPTREGYTFVEWRGSSYQPGDAYNETDAAGFIGDSLTAIWSQNSVTPDEPATPVTPGSDTGETDDKNTADSKTKGSTTEDSGTSKTGSGTDDESTMNTGDPAQTVWYAVSIAAAAAALAGILVWRRKREN